MDPLIVARAVHVLAVAAWIGGVAFVTLVLLPSAGEAADAAAGLAWFSKVERRFAWQARLWVILAGLSGLYMVDGLGLWSAFGQAQYWWLDAMVALWAAFALVLFVAEPMFLDRWLAAQAQRDPAGALRLIRRLHWLMLAASAATIAGAVAGSHGASFGG
jgi:uncharacterized membrane protein